MTNSRKKTIDTLWYKDAIIYELHIKAFNDSNGDGIGDFEGLMEKLDYIQKLGVTAIWLLPFYPSPQRDDGYDIADYYSVNPAYGNIEQFKDFLDEAHTRGLKVITELVINHTSDQHPWFQRARRAPKGSVEREYYVWSDDPTQYSDVRIIFQDFETSNWTWDPIAQQYYWHRFYHHQPDLNYDNPTVQDEVFRVLDYWCAMGVDGFRLDAVPYLFEREHTNGENLPETHAFLKKLRAYVDSKYPGTLLLAEANMWPEDAASYFGDGDECHMNYHFPLMPRLFMSLQMEDSYPVTDIFAQTPDIPETCQWAIFLRNHDELTLEMVTDEERDYMYKVYVTDPKSKINLGIRHRLAPLMKNNRKKIELLNYLLFSLPGTPVIYYGDEIGMGDNYYLGDRNGVRTPMQWSSERNSGFSRANPQQLYLPLITDPEYHYEAVNVEMQSRNTSSLFWWMTRLINIRKKNPAFSRGDMCFVNTGNSKILAFVRSYQEKHVLVVVNLSRHVQYAELNIENFSDYTPVEILGNNSFPTIKKGTPYFVTLGGYDCLWFSLSKPEIKPNDDVSLGIVLDSKAALLENDVLQELQQEVLPYYITKMRWFGGKARQLDNISISAIAPISAAKDTIYITLLEVTYKEGLPETYQLPIALADGVTAKQIIENTPLAVICDVIIGKKNAVLYDAVFSENYRMLLFDNMAGNAGVTLGKSEIFFNSTGELGEYRREHKEINSRVLSAEQSNTSIAYNNAYFLKIYRKVEPVINPDLEITRFLAENTDYKNIPTYAGAIEWRHGKDTMVLGMIQEMVSHNSDAWTYALEKLENFNEKVLEILLHKKTLPALKGTLSAPVSYENTPQAIKLLLDASAADNMRLLGVRTAEMHIALGSDNDLPGFRPEAFSLHYQRSLYSSFVSLVRKTFSSQLRNMKKLSPDVRASAEEVLGMKKDILVAFKRIYSKKISVLKTRIHGDFHLGQALFTGKDFVLLDFEGEPSRSYSERLLKRSPLRDVAGMVRSFHYAAHGSLILNSKINPADRKKLLPYVDQWYHYMSGYFMQGYLDTISGYPYIPVSRDDFEILLHTYLLEKAIYELGYELNNRPEWVSIPLNGIKAVMKMMHEHDRK